MLGGSGGKDAARFSNQGPFNPQLAGGVEKLTHLPAHIAKPGGSTKEDSVGGGKLLHATDRYAGQILLGLGGPHLGNHLSGQCFRHPTEIDFDAFDLTRPFRRSLGHLRDMSVERIENDQ